MSCNICTQITDNAEEGKDVKLTKRQDKTILRKQLAYVVAMSGMKSIDCIQPVKDILEELEEFIK